MAKGEYVYFDWLWLRGNVRILIGCSQGRICLFSLVGVKGECLYFDWLWLRGNVIIFDWLWLRGNVYILLGCG